MLRMDVIDGIDQGRTLTCSGRRPRTIGRASTRMPVTDHRTSRRHARVWVEQQQWLIQDLDSRHGTYVNGKRIDQPTPLALGDEVRIGRLTLVVREATPPTPQRRQRPREAPVPATAPPPAVDLPDEPGPSLALVVEGRRDGEPTPLAGRVLHTRGPAWIGRDAAAPLGLDDERVALRHARVDPTHTGWRITDLHTHAGTFINGWRIAEPSPLREGDRLWIGRLRLAVVRAVAHEATPPPAAQTHAPDDAHDTPDLLDLPTDEPADEPPAELPARPPRPAEPGDPVMKHMKMIFPPFKPVRMDVSEPEEGDPQPQRTRSFRRLLPSLIRRRD